MTQKGDESHISVMKLLSPRTRFRNIENPLEPAESNNAKLQRYSNLPIVTDIKPSARPPNIETGEQRPQSNAELLCSPRQKPKELPKATKGNKNDPELKSLMLSPTASRHNRVVSLFPTSKPLDQMALTQTKSLHKASDAFLSNRIHLPAAPPPPKENAEVKEDIAPNERPVITKLPSRPSEPHVRSPRMQASPKQSPKMPGATAARVDRSPMMNALIGRIGAARMENAEKEKDNNLLGFSPNLERRIKNFLEEKDITLSDKSPPPFISNFRLAISTSPTVNPVAEKPDCSAFPMPNTPKPNLKQLSLGNSAMFQKRQNDVRKTLQKLET